MKMASVATTTPTTAAVLGVVILLLMSVLLASIGIESLFNSEVAIRSIRCGEEVESVDRDMVNSEIGRENVRQ